MKLCNICPWGGGVRRTVTTDTIRVMLPIFSYLQSSKIKLNFSTCPSCAHSIQSQSIQGPEFMNHLVLFFSSGIVDSSRTFCFGLLYLFKIWIRTEKRFWALT